MLVVPDVNGTKTEWKTFEKRRLIIMALSKNHATKREIAIATGLPQTTVTRYVDIMHAENMLYIKKYVLRGRCYRPSYAFGSEMDAEKPPRISCAEKYKKRLIRLKIDPELRMRHEISMQKRAAKRREIKRDPLMQAFYGSV